MNALSSRSLIDALHTDRPATDRADKMRLYGWLIGAWEMDAVIHGDAGAKQAGGEIHFGWMLEGRAIQDVWVMPPRAARRPDLPVMGNFYGTTLRVYDPAAISGTSCGSIR